MKMTNQQYLEFAQEEFDSMMVLIEKKNKDYTGGRGPFYNFNGSEAYGVPPLVGLMIRMADKVKRLETFATKGELQNESIEDAFKDLIGYSVLALGMIKESKFVEKETYRTLQEGELTALDKYCDTVLPSGDRSGWE